MLLQGSMALAMQAKVVALLILGLLMPVLAVGVVVLVRAWRR